MNYLVSIQKNEHRTIKEWFDWHNKLGFDKIIVFNNGPKPYNIEGMIEFDCSKLTNPQPQMYNVLFNQLDNYGDTLTVLDRRRVSSL